MACHTIPSKPSVVDTVRLRMSCLIRTCIPFANTHTLPQVQDGAGDVFGPILQRSAQAERIRSVQLLLKRFGGLFSAPQRVTALGGARDYEQVRCCCCRCCCCCCISYKLRQRLSVVFQMVRFSGRLFRKSRTLAWLGCGFCLEY